MAGFKDIIKREQIDALERREKLVEDNLNMRMFIIAKEMEKLRIEAEAIREAQELFYERLTETWWQKIKRALR